MLRSLSLALLLLLGALTTATAVDLESFEFADPDGTQLTAAANTANPGNQWFYDEEATSPGDEGTGDVSSVQSGAYRVITDSSFDTGLESRFLDIDNVASGTVYLSATFSSWNFGTYDGETNEQVRFTFLDDDTGNSGSTVTAQMQIRRNADTGSMELVGDAIGTAGSFDIANTVTLPNSQTEAFTMVLALDQTSHSYDIFYKEGTNPSQVLGLGGSSRARQANSVRFVTGSFGAENFLPFLVTEEANVDRITVSDTNPLTDLVSLTVDRETGAMTLVNDSGAAVSGVTGVTLESTISAIDLTDFADFSGTLGDGQSVSLDSSPSSAPGVWLQNPVEDIRAELALSGGGVRTLDVNFVGNGGEKWELGDLNFNGTIDVDDYAILAAGAETDLAALAPGESYGFGDLNGDGANDATDFSLFKTTYIAANGAPAFARLVAGVPEPTGACLAAVGLLGLGMRRRHLAKNYSQVEPPMTKKNYLPAWQVLAVACLLSVGSQRAHAIFFEDFQFNDTEGTPLTGVTNSVNPSVTFDEDPDTLDVTTNGFGQLNASQKANTGFGTNYLDIDPAITSGIVYGVMELTWDFQSVLDTAENEQIRLSFINADPRSTFITSQFQLIRTDDNVLTLEGNAIGTGATDIAPVTINGGSLTQTDKFLAVLATDFDNDTYEVLYSNNAGSSFNLLGSGAIDPDRGIESVRLTLNNDLSNDNILIDRLYLADELPIVVEPDLLTFQVHPKSGYAAIANATESAFEIDYYRVQSGDNSLLASAWRSLEDQAVDAVDGPDAGSTAGDGVGETWTEAGGSDAGVLSESFLLNSSALAEGEALTLGRAIDLTGDSSQLDFEYRDAESGNVFTGLVELAEGLAGDYNLDGRVDAADYTVWRDNASGLFVAADYNVWANNYGATAAMANSSAVPEPTAATLLLLAGLSIGTRFGRQ